METTKNDLRLAVGGATAAGGRATNEDSVFVGPVGDPGLAAADGPTSFVLAVADGMGGHSGGDVASALAIETLKAAFAGDPGSDLALALKQAFRRANEVIYQRGQSQAAEATMGTTLVAAVTRGKYATIASIGDSRAYLARANRLNQITKDHSLVAEQVAEGRLPAARARESAQRNVLTHALGQREKLDSKLPNIFEIMLLPEDRLLLCTDGFYDVVGDDEMLRAVVEYEPDAAARELIDVAVRRGTTDNVSAAVMEVRPARVRERELVTVSTDAGRSFLVPALAAVAAIIFVAIVIFALMAS